MTDKKQLETEKKLAGERAVEFVKDGMTIGLGTGSTVYYAIMKIGEMVKNGLKIKAVSSSNATTKLSESLSIQLEEIDDADRIDLNIDGADEVDNNLNGIKGGGGALLFEKIVALKSIKNIWIADSSKMSERLGSFPLPAEVIPFGYKRVENEIRKYGLRPVLRMKDGSNYKTDSGNYILDLHNDRNIDLIKIEKNLKFITGVVETGLFIGLADLLIIGRGTTTEIIYKKK